MSKVDARRERAMTAARPAYAANARDVNGVDTLEAVVDAVLSTIPQVVLLEAPDVVTAEFIEKISQQTTEENMFCFVLGEGWRLSERFIEQDADGWLIRVPDEWK